MTIWQSFFFYIGNICTNILCQDVPSITLAVSSLHNFLLSLLLFSIIQYLLISLHTIILVFTIADCAILKFMWHRGRKCSIDQWKIPCTPLTHIMFNNAEIYGCTCLYWMEAFHSLMYIFTSHLVRKLFRGLHFIISAAFIYYQGVKVKLTYEQNIMAR